MIEVIRNPKGDIIAVCEWLLFNEKGLLDDKGTFIMIAELEINKECRGNGVMKKMIKAIHVRSLGANKVFFWRKIKYPTRDFHIYDVNRLLRRAG